MKYPQSEETIVFKHDNPEARVYNFDLNLIKEQLEHWYSEQDKENRKKVKKLKKKDLTKCPPAIIEKIDKDKYIILDAHHHLMAALKQGRTRYPAYVKLGYASDEDLIGNNNVKKSLDKNHLKKKVLIDKNGHQVTRWVETDKKEDKLSLYDQLLNKKEERWYNADNKFYIEKTKATNVLKKLQKESPNDSFKIVPVNDAFRIDKKHIVSPTPSKISRNVNIYINDELINLSANETESVRDDIFVIFKKYPNVRFVNNSNFSTDFYVASKYFHGGKEFDKEIDDLKEKLTKEGNSKYAQRMAGSGLISTIRDNANESKNILKSFPVITLRSDSIGTLDLLKGRKAEPKSFAINESKRLKKSFKNTPVINTSKYKKKIITDKNGKRTTKWVTIEKPESEKDKLIKLIQQKKEQARYLSGGKKGAWGKTSNADSKRSDEISKLESKLKLMDIKPKKQKKAKDKKPEKTIQQLKAKAYKRNRFSQIKEIDRKQIITDPKTFQGRPTPFSEHSVNKIVSEGYDKTNDPIVVWKDPKKNKFVVISGHSRFEASERLYKKGDKSLKTMPVKEFLGSKKDAFNYATLESNRASTQEGFASDVKAVKSMLEQGFNKEKMLKYVKPKSYLEKVINYTFLNTNGKFMEYLDSDSKTSFPYIERNADWVGTLRKKYPNQLTDQHESGIFDYMYKNDMKSLGINKEKLFNMIDKKVNNIGFDKSKPLNLKDVVSTSAITKDAAIIIKQHENEIVSLNGEINKYEDMAVNAMIEGNAAIAKKYDDNITNLRKRIFESKMKLQKMKNSVKQVENQITGDLFTVSPAKLKKALSHKDRTILSEQSKVNFENKEEVDKHNTTFETSVLNNVLNSKMDFYTGKKQNVPLLNSSEEQIVKNFIESYNTGEGSKYVKIKQAITKSGMKPDLFKKVQSYLRF